MTHPHNQSPREAIQSLEQALEQVSRLVDTLGISYEDARRRLLGEKDTRSVQEEEPATTQMSRRAHPSSWRRTGPNYGDSARLELPPGEDMYPEVLPYQSPEEVASSHEGYLAATAALAEIRARKHNAR